MLPRSRRMSAGQMDEVMKKGRVFHSPLFMVRAVVETTETRIAALAPKKTFKKATERNSIRRKIYVAIEPFTDLLSPPAHIAVFAKPGTSDHPTTELSEDLRNLFVKAGLLR